MQRYNKIIKCDNCCHKITACLRKFINFGVLVVTSIPYTRKPLCYFNNLLFKEIAMTTNEFIRLTSYILLFLCVST